MTHVFQVDHKGDVAPDSGVELALAGGQAEATWRPRSTRLSVGRKHPPASLLTVVGQNLSVPLKKINKYVLNETHIDECIWCAVH